MVETARAGKIRKLHKAFLRWHDPENWPILREGLMRMGRADLIGNGPNCLVPRHQPAAVATPCGKQDGAHKAGSPRGAERKERAGKQGGRHEGARAGSTRQEAARRGKR